MGQSRQKLHDLFLTLVPNVYFQPPNGLAMKFPCIVYKRSYRNNLHADNTSYRSTKRYQVTIIDQDPDSQIPEKVAELPMCSYNRFYTADNLNHDVYELYF